MLCLVSAWTHCAFAEDEILISDEQVLAHLNSFQELRWYEAIDLKQQGESDIKSGNWYLNRKASILNPDTNLEESHAVGRRLVKQGKGKIEAAELAIEQLRALARQRIAENEAATQTVEYSLTIEPIEQSKAISDHSRFGLESAWVQGYSHVYFAGHFIRENGRTTKSDELSQKFGENIKQLDGTRFTVQNADSLGFRENQFSTTGDALDKKAAVIVSVAYPQQQIGYALWTTHIIDSQTTIVTDSVIHTVFETPVLSSDALALEVKLIDTNGFLDRVAQFSDQYTYRMDYAAWSADSTIAGIWIPELIRALVKQEVQARTNAQTLLLEIFHEESWAPSNELAPLGDARWIIDYSGSTHETPKIFLKAGADSQPNPVDVGVVSLKFPEYEAPTASPAASNGATKQGKESGV